jgi:hypothetical protein
VPIATGISAVSQVHLMAVCVLARLLLLLLIVGSIDWVILLLIFSASFLVSVPARALYRILECIIEMYRVIASRSDTDMSVAFLANMFAFNISLSVSGL